MKKLQPLFSLLIGLALAAMALAADDKDKLSAAEIINKHLAAVGGKAAMAKFKSRVAIGTARKDNDTAAPMAVMSEAPNRVSAIYQFEGFNWQLTYDGGKAIVRPVLSRANTPIMEKYQDMLATGTMFNGMALYNALAQGETENVKFEAKGLKKVRGRPAYTVEMRRNKDKALLYFDAETFMWVRTDYGSVHLTREMGSFTNAIESKDQETTYDFYVETSDFKDVDGVKLPFKFEIVATAPILKQKNVGTIVATIKEYRHNVAIDPKMFQ
ncbi:MAG TPA: hypothetical protein VKA60_04605 [Blastocatellia bacterium]|nr:hypothetical protein [Blastocatellia bacterium]